MTKTHKLLTLALSATLAFAACGKDDETTTPTTPTDGEKRIEWRETYRYVHDSSEEYTQGRFSRIKCTWEGDKLKRYEAFDDDNSSRGYCEISYENGLAKELRMYEENGEIRRTATFFYTGDKVTRVRTTSYDDEGTWEGEYTYEYNSAGEVVKVNRPSGSTITYTWENGNIVEARFSSGGMETYTYDNKVNPDQALSVIAYVEPAAQGFSRNNIVSSTYTEEGYEDRDDYTYTYNGDYPTSQKHSYSSSYSSSYSESYSATFFRYTDGSGMAAPEMFRIKIEDGYDYNSRPYYVIGGGTYAKGDKVVIRTDSKYYHNHNDTFYTFSRWDDGNTDNPRTFTATADVTLRPIYTAAE